ncbi:probable aspartic proteinase GIP2 [Ricinus communis]|uniref:probable aspartic proteinase GIP2 n=1 Tax=Ricinus communis TaxID=3988 RepID=UPI000D68D0BC|nr:probable aspartic proteinase GIP2 [Ricinus communis]|eukprot:XP_025012761.1 uncharacterized protein LOC107261110 [Ricinus communis]
MVQDVISLQSINGKNPGRNFSVPNVRFVCGTGDMLERLADGILGMASWLCGVIFFDVGPYSINLLTTHSQSSTDYFIAVKTLKFKFNKTLLSIDNAGKGVARISAVHPYTVLHTSIYKAVIKGFAKQMKIFIQVNPVYAFSQLAMDINEYGPVVPFTDLVLESEGSVYWRI